MLCISVRQPWAWSIIHAGKDIENRDWATKVRGRVLIHAAKGMTNDEFAKSADFIHRLGITLPHQQSLVRGAIIGSVEITDCVSAYEMSRSPRRSPWFFGEYGFVLRDAQMINPIPYAGRLGFFEVPASVVTP